MRVLKNILGVCVDIVLFLLTILPALLLYLVGKIFKINFNDKLYKLQVKLNERRIKNKLTKK